LDDAEDWRPRIQRWNGSTWSQTSLPNWVGGLSEVPCSAADACTAVGFFGNDDFGATVARWNGSLWTPQNLGATTPDPLPGDRVGQAVSCSSTTTCIAISDALANRWNGVTWASQQLPPNAQHAEFDGVSCTSPTSCVAVGGLEKYGNKPIALVLSHSRSRLVQPPTKTTRRSPLVR
jgi:hypothetical protein